MICPSFFAIIPSKAQDCFFSRRRNQWTYPGLIFFSFFAFLLPVFSPAQIIPQPQKIKYAEGSFIFPEKIGISLLNDPIASNLYTAQTINKNIREKLALSTYLETKVQKAQIILSLISQEDALRQGIPVQELKQSYRLTIASNKILIEASDPQGIFYGAQSLSQLIGHMKGHSLKNQQILDWPKFQWRGIGEDLSRGQIPKKETFFKMIDFMARYKINYYLLYLEDVLKIDAYSEFGEDRDNLTKAEIKELVAYAQKNFVTIIPYFPIIASQDHLLSQAAFSKMAEFPGSASFCVDCPLTYPFLEKVLTEIQNVFEAPFIHLGGAPHPDFGQGRSQETKTRLGLSNLYQQHLRKVSGFCKKKRKTVILRGSLFQSFPELADSLTNYQVFWENESYVFPSELGPTSLPGPRGKHSIVLDPNREQLLFPDIKKSALKIRALAQKAPADEFIGIWMQRKDKWLSASWGALFLPLYGHLAQQSWNPRTKIAFADFQNRFFNDFYGSDTKTQGLYDKVFEGLNQLSWEEYWAHPLAQLFSEKESQHKKDSLYFAQKEKDWENIDHQLDTLSKQAQNERQASLLEVMGGLAELGKFYLKKEKLQALMQSYHLRELLERDSLVNELENIIFDLENLKNEYARVWNKFYRPEGLKLLEDRFMRLTRYFEESKDQLLFKKKFQSPFLNSQWIKACLPQAIQDTCLQSVTFRKDFNLDKIPFAASIQIMADNYAKVYFNNQFLCELSARPSQSYEVESQRYKLLDIKSFLKKGNNTLKMEVINYHPTSANQAAAINVIINFRQGLKSWSLASDEHWQMRDPIQSKIRGKDIWVPALLYDREEKYLAPGFFSNRSSWLSHQP